MMKENETEENETKETQKVKTKRDVYVAYICARCDTDFGINEMGCNLKIGTYAMVCPMCGCKRFHVYHVVDEIEIPVRERPPLMKTEELQQINEESEADDEW